MPTGGQGSVLGAVIGALIISTITTGLIQFGVTQDWALFATGAAVIAAVALDAFLKRRRQRAAERLGVSAATAGQPGPKSDLEVGVGITEDVAGVGAGQAKPQLKKEE